MRVVVEVTREDINAGSRGNCFLCPIARAMRRAGLSSVSAGDNWKLSFWSGQKLIRRRMSREARAFVDRFDRNRRVKPFEIRLNVPSSAVER